jgi:hypothetical protein
VVTNEWLWLRPSELTEFHPNPSLWGSDGIPHPDSAMQGGTSDCWFLAAASAVTQDPSRIKRLFKNTELSTDGAYEIHYYVRGEKVSVIIDDRIPVANRYGYPTKYNGVAPNGGYWLVFMEKAYAKLNINYY